MGKKKNKFQFDSIDFIKYIWLNRRILIIVGIIAAVISAAIAFSIPSKFKSTVILFPATSGSVSKSVLTDQNLVREDLLKFGGEEEGEQLMQVLYSNALLEGVVKHLNLTAHYNINTKSPNWRSDIEKVFKGNVKFHRTEYMSIVIDVVDKDKKMAAIIANGIASEVDSVIQNIGQQRANKAFQIVNDEYNFLNNEVAVLRDSLKKVEELDVIAFQQGGKVYHAAYAKAISSGKMAGALALEKKLKLIAKNTELYNALNQRISSEAGQIIALYEKLREAKVNVEQIVPHKFVVDYAVPADVKDSPKRSIIVLISIIVSVFFVLVILLINDNIINKLKEC